MRQFLKKKQKKCALQKENMNKNEEYEKYNEGKRKNEGIKT